MPKNSNRQNGFYSDEGEQGYLVSVSDMMSGLIFLFIITLMVFVINFNREKIKKEVETENVKVEVKNLKKIKDELTDAKSTRTQLLQDLKESLKKSGVLVKIDVEKGLLHVPEEILFESGKAEFQEGGEASLSILAKNLFSRLPCYSGKRTDKSNPNCLSTFKPGRLEAVLVEGHTDNVPIRSRDFNDNWELSAKRSIVTYQFLIQEEPGLANLLNTDGDPLFGVSGYADTRPVVRHNKIQAEPSNRRIDLRFILASPRPEQDL